jgi:hypothetical protein
MEIEISFERHPAGFDRLGELLVRLLKAFGKQVKFKAHEKLHDNPERIKTPKNPS